ncbi:hypothetical protein AB0E83_28765 [Streptomyces sp. NPDC035033]|uniref:hypothetical protein n=1 Tax=Streptomyces sp. NPDC035033 TaxID=3155368 RepID=UPI0033D4943D
MALLAGVLTLLLVACACGALETADRFFRRPRTLEARAALRARHRPWRWVFAALAVGAAWQCVEAFREAEAWSGAGRDASVERLEAVAEHLESEPRLKFLVGQGSWGEYIEDGIGRPGEEHVVTLVSAAGDTERYAVDGACLTVTAKVAPGQAPPKYAHLDDRLYELDAEVAGGPCP